MKERRGMRGRASELAETVVAGVKRRQAARVPRVLLYDEHGRPRTLAAASPEAQTLIATARSMVDVAGPIEPDPDEGRLDGEPPEDE